MNLLKYSVFLILITLIHVVAAMENKDIQSNTLADEPKQYVIKKEEMHGSRIKGANRLLVSINARNSNRLIIPEQSQNPLGAGVKAEWIQGEEDGTIDLELAKQLRNTIHDTWFWDLGRGNIIFMSNGNLALTDTELKGFASDPITGLGVLLRCHKFTSDAADYIAAQLKDAESKQEIYAQQFRQMLEERMNQKSNDNLN